MLRKLHVLHSLKVARRAVAEKINPVQVLVREAKDVYRSQFKEEPDVAVFAPGRVNLIGEHSDYNDGFVMPMALPLVTVIVGKKAPGEESTVYTTHDFKEKQVTFAMPNQDAIPRDGPKWSLYVKGVVAKYLGGLAPAFTAVVHSSVPLGGGLSSSASLEVATYVFLDALTGDTSVSMTDKVLACQKAENEYAEMPCGIMDQYISFMGKEGHALLIDCRSMTSTLIPVADENVVFLVINSNVKHELTSSEFPTRRKQCEEAARILKKASLRDANLEDIQHLQSIKTDEVIVRRARHVITERHRTVEGAEMLKQRNYDKFGLLMKESHLSLKEDFEVSCPELDELVALALEVDGVLGSRMTGAGFGGCTVSLVCTHAVDNMIDHIKKNYKGNATFYICKPGPGASRI